MLKLLFQLKATLVWCAHHYPACPFNEAEWRIYALESAQLDAPMPEQNLAAKHLWQFDVREGIKPFEACMDF